MANFKNEKDPKIVQEGQVDETQGKGSETKAEEGTTKQEQKPEKAVKPEETPKPKKEDNPAYKGNSTGKRVRIEKTYHGLKSDDKFTHEKHGECTIKKVFIATNGYEYVIAKNDKGFYGDIRADKINVSEEPK